uniref:tRNA synthetases class I catalytic domain-containing protein n=1 Tax=Phlebotomus papatasi TaxID=29031 RepID=A0A1B0DC74_PHLPP
MRWIQPKDGFSTGIEVYNCIVRRKVPLILRRKYLATLYTCGPTVYDDTHIGHASTYVKLDAIRRILYNHFGIRVFSVMNITDIDDKIIRKSHERKCLWETIARENEDKFWKDLRALDVLEPHVKMRNFISFVNKEINSSSNEGQSSPEVGIIRICREFILECLKNFGFSIPGENAESLHGSPADNVLDKIIEIRNSLRKEKDFSAADAIRDGLRDVGIEIKDHGQLSSWSRR